MEERQESKPDALLGALLSNSELLKRISELPKALGDQKERIETEESTAAAPVSVSPPNIGADSLSALLQNPAMLEKLPSVIAALAPMMAANGKKGDSASDRGSDRDRLLLALKPFLSAERRLAVDRIIQLAKLGSLLENLQ